ncbi:hypothetical protein [Macrococcus carouselicus]|uniref:Uncharacterized protein n=1 Tax=Macrococcus carouselicus TaxID=69969 RepID=A0A9Q8CNI5_9STAP|nr:hypothetical protein [Macrococcus carouselicus]TDM04074.1 hypothetical protein ERX40_02580 [Macrococcus carouselicus]
MQQIYLFNQEGIFNGVDIVDNLTILDADGREVSVLPTNATLIKPPDGLYKAQFDGEKWIETITEEELAELNKITSSPTLKERVDVLEGAVVEIMETTL